MTPPELKAALMLLYGDEGWRNRAAEELGLNVSTLTRQVNGTVPMSGPLVAAVKALLQLKILREQRAEYVRNWRARQGEPGE